MPTPTQRIPTDSKEVAAGKAEEENKFFFPRGTQPNTTPKGKVMAKVSRDRKLFRTHAGLSNKRLTMVALQVSRALATMIA
jgi:hypothetical protein